MAATADRFLVLLSRTWDSFQRVVQPLLIGAVVVQAVTIVLQLATGAPVGQQVSPAQVPLMLAGSVIGIALSILIYTYFLVVTVKGEKNPKVALRRGIDLIIPLIVIGFWTTIYSYIWIALIAAVFLFAGGRNESLAILNIVGVLGMILAIVFAFIRLPRYYLSIYIFIKEKTTAKNAVLTSWKRTEGYWGKLVGNGLLLGLVMLPVGIGVGILTGAVYAATGVYSQLGTAAADTVPVLPPSAIIFGGLIGIVSLLMQAFGMSFWSHMTDTITKHPRHSKKK